MNIKKCCHCKEELSIDCFQKNRAAPDGLQYRCRACTKLSGKACRIKRGHLWLQKADLWKNRPENRERRNAATRARMAKRKLENPDKLREERRRWQLATKYGLTPELKQVLVEVQGGVCSICFIPIDAITCATDHDHKNDYVRGMLCRPCNSALGLFKDSPDILRRAALYLEESKSIILDPSIKDFIIATELLENVNGRESEEPVVVSEPSSA